MMCAFYSFKNVLRIQSALHKWHFWIWKLQVQNFGYKNCFECQNKKIFCTHHVLDMFWSCNFLEHSVAILWVNWFKNECFWHRFTCTRNSLAFLIIKNFTLLIPFQEPHPISELTKFMNDPCLSFEKNQPNLPLKCSNIYVMQRRHVC